MVPNWQAGPHTSQPTGGAEQWPPRTGQPPTLRCDAKVFETKFAQEGKNVYDGGAKGGEAWKVLIRGYLLGRVPMMKFLLKWAEDHGNAPIMPEVVAALAP